jgi:hypothetical protein
MNYHATLVGTSATLLRTGRVFLAKSRLYYINKFIISKQVYHRQQSNNIFLSLQRVYFICWIILDQLIIPIK